MNTFTSGCQFSKYICLLLAAWACCFYSIAQNTSDTSIWNKLRSLEDNTSLSVKEKLPLALELKYQCERKKLTEDSVYARILHRVGYYDYFVNNSIATKNALMYTYNAIRINSSRRKNVTPVFCLNSYNNLGIFYRSLKMYQIAAQYFDSAIAIRRQFNATVVPEVVLLLGRAEMLHAAGDYQKAVEEINIAIPQAKAEKDSSKLQSLLNQRALSYLMEGNLEKAWTDINLAGELTKRFSLHTEEINNIITKAQILGKKKDFSNALFLFNNALKQRLQTNDFLRIANDYTNLGNFYLDDMLDYSKAKTCYLNTALYAFKVKDQETIAKAHSNLEYCSYMQHNFKDAEYYCSLAMEDLNLTSGNNILINPSSDVLNSVNNKELIFAILGNKTVLMLEQYKKARNKNYLDAWLHTVLLTDTFITKMRHEQTGEQSKLHWRNRTREFFAKAIEACHLINDAGLAFYFMEKSRAVLLNDQLNELGASSYLSQKEAAKEWEFQISVITQQQKLAELKPNEPGYEKELSRLSLVKADLEHYLKTLEINYPLYYQYKYSDEVPSLKDLQVQLSKNRQSFIHYFLSDTAGYILCITPSHTKLLQLSNSEFNSGMLVKFLQSCSYQLGSNDEFRSFARQSYSLYKQLFPSVEISKGRVVICPDHFLIPFEALCKDSSGTQYLINDYIFSYVYSARNLLKKYNTSQACGDFIGFAPVSFNAFPYVADLKQSEEALERSAMHYNTTKLLTNSQATRYNFINAASGYTIVNVFSHALADTTENEPVLYMYDSIIHLSELQLIYKPVTKLVVLSACQTNVGKNAKGEGVLSLARGFAAAGIPSVSATLWQADERSIYDISEKFHEYLTQGMPKDEALQKAKLYFIKNGEHENPFPYYWANMILVGNNDPVILSKNHHIWLWLIATTLVAAALLLFLKKR